MHPPSALQGVSAGLLLEAAPDAMVVSDAQGLIILVNSQTERVFGYTRAELLGQPIDVLMPERFRARPEGPPAGSPAAPRPRVLCAGPDQRACRRDGTEFPVDILLSPLATAAGPMVISAIRDVTARQQAEESLRQLNEEVEARVTRRTAALQEANQELDAFAHSVSHDLRAPLRAISRFGHFLTTECAATFDDRGRGYLRRMLESTARMNGLIDDLLQFAHAARADLRRLPVDLGALAQEVVGELQQAEPDRRVTFTCAPGLRTLGDPRLLRVALTNLLGNAWKYTGRVSEARVDLGVAPAPAGDAFFIRDNGAGFDMQYAHRLFGAFQRLHSAADFEGTGVGLAIVQRIVHRHGGKIWAASKVNDGATFHFTLPAAPASEGDGDRSW